MTIALPTAMTHSLSVHDFRWTHDNNPLILVALAALGVTAFYYLRPRMARSLAAKISFWGLFGFCQISLWGGFSTQLTAIAQCTESWPEISHLEGARMRKAAVRMRELVGIARQLAPDAENDEVLLLPGDPNVEAWFERPGPALTSAIPFADQYWRRYADEDLRRLEAKPPKVIIIGPRPSWRYFHTGWTISSGTESLIDKIEAFMLRDRYILVAQHPIIYKGQLEHMDVYLRKPDSPPLN